MVPPVAAACCMVMEPRAGYGEINRTEVVEESANDFLDRCLVRLIEKGGVVLVRCLVNLYFVLM